MNLSWLAAAFIFMPMLEIMVLLRVHEAYGLANTFGLIVITGFVGALMAKAQGMMVLAEINRDLAEGRMPAPRLIDGFMIIIAGVLLITPGLVTDCFGFLLLVPFVRSVIRSWMRAKFEKMIANGQVSMWRGGGGRF